MRLIVSAVESRLIRALRRGGFAISSATGWPIYRAGDSRRRTIGKLSNVIVDELRAKDFLVAHAGGPSRLCWNEAAADIDIISHEKPAGPPKQARKPLRARSLTEQAARLERSGAGRVRLISAAQRFQADAERASSSQYVTMRWDQTPISRGSAKQPHMGPGEAASRAAANLRHIRDKIGDEDFALLELVLIGEISRAGLTRRTGLTPRGALRLMFNAMTGLADAYDLAVPSAD